MGGRFCQFEVALISTFMMIREVSWFTVALDLQFIILDIRILTPKVQSYLSHLLVLVVGRWPRSSTLSRRQPISNILISCMAKKIKIKNSLHTKVMLFRNQTYNQKAPTYLTTYLPNLVV